MNAKKFFEELVILLEKTSRNKMVVHSEESSAGVRGINEKPGDGINHSFEYGRLIDYGEQLFYLYIESLRKPGSKEETSVEWENQHFQEFLKNTVLILYAVDRINRSIESKLVTIPLADYESLQLGMEGSGKVIRRLEMLVGNYLNDFSALRSTDTLENRAESITSVRPKRSRPQAKGFVTKMHTDVPELFMESCNIQYAEETQKFQSYPVLYGTDRKKKNPEKKDKIRFGEERDEKLNLGVCKVSIPRMHRQGELERPGWFHELFFGESPEKDFTILENEIVGQSRFFELLKERFVESGENDVLLFVHGFNTSFEDSLYRTAQLGYDLCFKGAVTTFSWPSRGKVLDYVSDTQSAEYSIPFLKEYIKLVLSSSSIGKLHIIAHSMGNVVLCGALKALKEEAVYPNAVVNQIILAAPDIDRDVFFMQIMPAIRTTRNITLYACDKDHALKISKGMRSGYVRLGEGGDNLLVTDGLDSIDASEVDMSILGHTYFAQTPSLLNEIHMVLQNLPPGKRMLKECTNAKKQKYWALKRT